MRLYLIRHARPEVGLGICYGRTDLAVSPQEHARVMTAVMPELPQNTPVFSSPLRRCRELALQIAQSLGSGDVMVDQRLAEMHFGAWEMRAWDDIPRMEIDAWARDLIAYRTDGGESVLQMAQRVRAFYEEMQRQKPENAIVVCHAGTIRLMSRFQDGESLTETALAAAQAGHNIAYGELVVLNC